MASKLVVVTASSRGIGRACCELILARPGSTTTLYATSRQGKDLNLSSERGSKVIYRPLDVTKMDSIKKLVSEIQSTGQSVDVLISSAGVQLDEQFNYENAKATLDINYRGTLQTLQAFIPIMSSNGRIVSLSSVGSTLNTFGKEVATRFRNISSLQELESFMQEYEEAVKQKKDTAAGFPTHSAYSVSKACINAFTSVLAKENTNLYINCCCPGWVNTEMGNIVGKPPKTPQEGAVIPMRLGFGDIGGVSGRYWANDSVGSTNEGKVQVW